MQTYFFLQEFNDTYCESKLCSYPTLHKCKQICHETDDGEYFRCDCYQGYELKGNDCIKKPENKCTCPNGSFCKNDMSKCECADGYIYDENACVLDVKRM
jgi:hypothetical protein